MTGPEADVALCICPPPWNNDYTPNPACPECRADTIAATDTGSTP